MTALTEFTRLEATGEYRPTPAAPAQEVVLSLGDASLTMTDTRSGVVAHWSLPAMQRINPGQTPADYAPGKDSPERMRTDDTTFIDGIERIHAAISRTPSDGRMPRITAGIALAAALGAALIWGPGLLRAYAVRTVPDAALETLGETMAAQIIRSSGRQCGGVAGQDALDRVARALPSGIPLHPVVQSGFPTDAMALPGGGIILSRAFIESAASPQPVIDALAAGAEASRRRVPLDALLADAGSFATLRFLVTGRLPRVTLATGVALETGADAPDLPGQAQAIGATVAAAALSDGDWVALQSICG